MTRYGRHLDVRGAPQSEPLPGREMVENSAGGYVFKITPWQRLERFLVLGCAGGTYYASERTLTLESADVVRWCAVADPRRFVRTLVRMRGGGRVPKLGPMIFALAVCAKLCGPKSARWAYSVLGDVCRTTSQLFEFLSCVRLVGGCPGSWGMKRAVSRWYQRRYDADQLEYQVIKYRQRYGWTHRDVLRACRVTWPYYDPRISGIFNRILGHDKPVGPAARFDAVEQLKDAEPDRAVDLIDQFNLPWEAVPTEKLRDPKVAAALLPRLPMTALFRQLGRYGSMGLLDPLSDAARHVILRLRQSDVLMKAGIHPIQVLSALMVYKQGLGGLGSLQWTPNREIVYALGEAVEMCFNDVEPTNKRIYLALDVSWSMRSGTIAGIPALTPAIGSAVMAMASARTEPLGGCYFAGFSHEMVPLTISSKDSIQDVVDLMYATKMGATDCAMPMLDALDKKMPVDAFVIYTDNETWYGDVHPVVALQEYRKKMKIPAKLVVVAMTATDFSIADPDDAGMMDVVGFDSAAPQVIADFIRGN